MHAAPKSPFVLCVVARPLTVLDTVLKGLVTVLIKDLETVLKG